MNNIKIAEKLIKIAKSLIAENNVQFYTKDQIINKQIRYCRKISRQALSSYFTNDALNEAFVQKTVKLDLSNIVEQYKKVIKVNVIMLYVDKVDKKDYDSNIIKPQYGYGTGQALVHNGKYYVVMYGHSEQCWDIDYFINTAVHELMHIINHQFDEDYDPDKNINNYYGHPVQEPTEDNNGGILYPGMYGDVNDDKFDEKYAEYYTCRAERKQTVHDLITWFEDMVRYKKMDDEQIKQFIETMIKSLDSKRKFFKWLDEMKKDKYFYDCSLPLIYHLALSKQQNGNKQDAIKILRDLYWKVIN